MFWCDLKDLRYFLMHLLNKTKEELFLKDLNKVVKSLDHNDKKTLSDWMSRLSQGEPISKIVGKKNFWKREFFINEHVLDPRPESETMIEAVVSELKDKDNHYNILDIGSGSGCLLLSLCDEYKNAAGKGIDISKQAIQVSDKNNNYKDRVLFINLSFKEFLNNNSEHFDIIISNPPYIAYDEELDKSVKNYDPKIALYAGETGLEQYESICECLKSLSFEYLFFEVGYRQAIDVTGLVLRKLNLNHTNTYKDILGIDRIVSFKKQ